MTRRTACLVTLCALVAGPAAAQEAATPTKGAARQAFRRWRTTERAAGAAALRLRRAQEAWIAARDALRRFRDHKTRAQLQSADLKARIDALETRMISARRSYEALSRGEQGRRYHELHRQAEAAFGAASSAVGGRLRATPDDLELRRMRAVLLTNKGRFRIARRDVAALLKHDPADAAALILQGRRQESEGEFAGAVASYEKALARQPSDEARLRCAVALFWLNRFAEARALRDLVEHLDQAPPQLQLDHDWYLKQPGLEAAERRWKREQALRKQEAARGDLPRVALETSRGKVVLELFEDQAPNAVASFVSLVEAKFYDGLTWHRVQRLRLAVSGRPGSRSKLDPEGPGYRIRPELGEQARSHFRGSVGLLATGRRRLLGSQFYVMLRPDPDLDRYCTVFGRVVEGLDVVTKLRKDDLLKTARVLRKRKHPYTPTKITR